MTSDSCKGAPLPSRGAGAEMTGQGKLEATARWWTVPYNEQNTKGNWRCTPAQGRYRKYKRDEGRVPRMEKSPCQIDDILPWSDKTIMIITQENQSRHTNTNYKPKSAITQSGRTPHRIRTIESREPPKSPRRAQGKNSTGRRSRVTGRSKNHRHRFPRGKRCLWENVLSKARHQDRGPTGRRLQKVEPPVNMSHEESTKDDNRGKYGAHTITGQRKSTQATGGSRAETRDTETTKKQRGLPYQNQRGKTFCHAKAQCVPGEFVTNALALDASRCAKCGPASS